MSLSSRSPCGRSLVAFPITLLVALAACSSGTTPSALSGSAVLQFSPTFTGFFATSGRCDPCISSLSNYEALVVVMSDDPNVQRECESGNVQYTMAPMGYHYLTVEAFSPQPIVPASYPIIAFDNANTPSTFALVSESRPSNSASLQYDGETGTVQLLQVGDVVEGTFTTASLDLSSDSPPGGYLSGSFAAPSCPFLLNMVFESPCTACPG